MSNIKENILTIGALMLGATGFVLMLICIGLKSIFERKEIK